MIERKHLWTTSLLGLLAAACTTDTASTADRVAALYGDDARNGDCAMTREQARAEAEALFPGATVIDVESDDAYGIPSWDVDLATENGGMAEAEFFVASCGLYEVESDDPNVELDVRGLVATPLADAIAAASAGRTGSVVHWELDREEDHRGAWVYDVTFDDDTEVTVSAANGSVLEDDASDDDDDASDDDDGTTDDDDHGADDDDDASDDDDDASDDDDDDTSDDDDDGLDDDDDSLS